MSAATLFPLTSARPVARRIDRTERRMRIREVRAEMVSFDCVRDTAGEAYSATNPAAVSAQLSALFNLKNDPQENLCALYLDSRMRVLAAECVYRGTINTAVVATRDIVRDALMLNATSIIVSHNHPSGNPQPSGEDLAFTRKLQQALALFDIELTDHVIIAGGDGYAVSLREKGYL